MSDKSQRLWEKMQDFCIKNPGKTAVIVRPAGQFTLSWTPNKDLPKGRLFVDFDIPKVSDGQS